LGWRIFNDLINHKFENPICNLDDPLLNIARPIQGDDSRTDIHEAENSILVDGVVAAADYAFG
jgi:hypothetical protein